MVAGGPPWRLRGPATSLRWLATPLPWLALLLTLYLLVPLGAFLVRLGGTPQRQLSSPGTGAALVISLETATVSTILIALLGIPLSYLLARGRGRTSRMLSVLVQLPIALPPLMSGILLLYLVGPYTTLGRLSGGRLTDDRIGIVLAQVFVAAPFLIVVARSTFAAQDPSLEEVAATLGHHRWARFARVALPVASQGIWAGLLLAWLRAFGEFGATVVLAYNPYSLPVFAYVRFGSTGLTATVLPVAVTLVVAALVLTAAVYRPRLRRRRPVPAPLPAIRSPAPARGQSLAFDINARLGTFELAVAHRAGVRQLAVLGASGAGKSFTARLLAGLAPADASEITLDGHDIAALPPERRHIGYVPQDSQLLPHLPVWQQVTFGVGADPSLAAYWLSRLHLDGLERRRPTELSGGQRRRVALVRALARAPRLLLLDEPFTGLDTTVRLELVRELRRLQRDTGLTTVLVTHDPEEAALLASDVLVLDGGRVLQAGAQPEVFARPATPQVARLLGIRNITEGTVHAPDVLAAGELRIGCATHDLPAGTPLSWCVRPDRVLVHRGGAHAGQLTDLVEHGAYRELELAVRGGPTVSAVTTSGQHYSLGEIYFFDLPRDAITVWPPGHGEVVSAVNGVAGG